MEILKELDYKELQKCSGQIACPFSFIYKGPIILRQTMDTGRRAREEICAQHCGKLYPKLYQANHCPCWVRDGIKPYVKKRFWQQLEKARKGGEEK